MNLDQLEHVLRAASTIVDETDVLVIGSPAVLGSIPDDQLPLGDVGREPVIQCMT